MAQNSSCRPTCLCSTMRDEGSAPQPQDAQEGNAFAPVGEAPHGNNYSRPGMYTP